MSSELDLIPTFLLKLCLSELLPVITKIVNMSLEEQTVTSQYKKAVIRPLLTKSSLDRVVKNYSHVSNLPYVLKSTE